MVATPRFRFKTEAIPAGGGEPHTPLPIAAFAVDYSGEHEVVRVGGLWT